jgi:hypothetical protein
MDTEASSGREPFLNTPIKQFWEVCDFRDAVRTDDAPVHFGSGPTVFALVAIAALSRLAFDFIDTGDQMKSFVLISALVIFLFVIAPSAKAQEMVHALTGSVSAIDPSNNTITVFQDSGSASTFKVMTSAKTRIAFDKDVAKTSTSAKQFEKKGSYVILFYYGLDPNRTAVALKDLGTGPFAATVGKVTDWDGHSHTLVVTGQNGSQHSFKLDSGTVAETYAGAVDETDLHVDKGNKVRVVSTQKNGDQTALFVRVM